MLLRDNVAQFQKNLTSVVTERRYKVTQEIGNNTSGQAR